MPRNRTPKSKADVSGASIVNPGRHRGRNAPARVNLIGEPYKAMTDEQRAYWSEFVATMPWLHAAHRPLLRLACMLSARMDGDIGVQASQALSAILSKLGATPVDESRIAHAEPEEEDPSDKFFRRAH